MKTAFSLPAISRVASAPASDSARLRIARAAPAGARFSTVLAAALLLAAAPARANCGAGIPIFLALSPAGGWFAGCGDDPGSVRAFFWEHHFASQGIGGASTGGLGPAGIDSGALSGAADFLFTPYDTTGQGRAPTPGAYQVLSDWGTFGPDGCPILEQEPDPGACPPGTTPGSMPVTDYVLAGSDLGSRLQAKAAVLSVDMNELFQLYVLDQAAAPAVDGDPCDYNGDAGSFRTAPAACGAIPAPDITSASCDGAGCDLAVSVAPHAVPIEDDCAVAFSKAIDCPRALFAGRAIMVRRAACDATSPASVASFDTRTFIMDAASSFPGTILPNFFPYAPEDLNLNGVRDDGEAPFVPVVLAGNDAATAAIRIPRIAGATDCAYLGVALLLDSAPDPAACEGPCAQVLTPLVSANPTAIPLLAGGADQVIDLAAGKVSGRATVSWVTTAETAVAGFDLIGVRKGGGTVRMNDALIAAKQGTTGMGASYSVSLGAGDLRGSAGVAVEVVMLDGTRVRFGPVPVQKQSLSGPIRGAPDWRADPQ